VERSKLELIAFHQENAGLDATEIHGNPVNYGFEETVQLKNAADLLCRLLHGDQYVYPALLEDCGS
ncbi:MAG: hypothetical protein DMG72_24850, partial [Acidobacteria bacterium]